MPTDNQLVQKITRGDRLALAELYARYFPIVWRFAAAQTARRSGIPNEDAARDITSETFLAAIRNIAAFDPVKAPFAAWLLGIARNKLADTHRTRPAPPLENHDTPAPALLDPLESHESRAAIARILDSLPDDERLALEWKYLDALPVRHIAARLGRSEKAAESLLHRARENFRTRYQTLHPQEPIP